MINNIAIFASGAGSNAKKIIAYFNLNLEKNIRVSVIVSNKKTAGVLDIARENNIPIIILDKENFYNPNHPTFNIQHSTFNIDYIVLAGFLWKIPAHLIQQFPDKIINIHPALLPKFGGKGMFGMNVHRAVIAVGELETGITIHFVNEKYDEGKIIFQKSFEIEKNDTAEIIQHKIQQLEHHYFPLIIEDLVKNKL